MTKFKNETKDRSPLIQEIDLQLYRVYSQMRDNTRLINSTAAKQRGLKELRHVLQSAKTHFSKTKEVKK